MPNLFEKLNAYWPPQAEQQRESADNENTQANKVLRVLQAAGANGLSRSQLHGQFGNNLHAGELNEALGSLLLSKKARYERTTGQKGSGRRAEMWFAR